MMNLEIKVKIDFNHLIKDLDLQDKIHKINLTIITIMGIDMIKITSIKQATTKDPMEINMRIIILGNNICPSIVLLTFRKDLKALWKIDRKIWEKICVILIKIIRKMIMEDLRIQMAGMMIIHIEQKACFMNKINKWFFLLQILQAIHFKGSSRSHLILKPWKNCKLSKTYKKLVKLQEHMLKFYKKLRIQKICKITAHQVVLEFVKDLRRYKMLEEQFIQC